MGDVGRQIDEQLGVRSRNQLQTFAVVVDPGLGQSWGGLAHEVGAEFLFEARRHRGQGRDPVRLFGLRTAGTRLPGGD